MGSCISKCRPKKKLKKDCNCNINDIDQEDRHFSHVQDKLVISHPSSMVVPIQNPVSPSPSAASSTSFSSVAGANSTSTSSGFSMASSLSSSSSCSSSLSISKDRSFSNEFLWSCAKENPQLIGRNVTMTKQALPAGRPGGAGSGSTQKKRARANSPTIVRQKSFRKEPDKVMISSSPTTLYHHLPSRNYSIRSPSPSRRFNGEIGSVRDYYSSPSMNATKEIHSRRSSANNHIIPKGITRKESFRTPASPKYDHVEKNNAILKSTSTSTRETNLIAHQIGSRNINSANIGVGEKDATNTTTANHDVEPMAVEDINNPLIALDCFIFL